MTTTSLPVTELVPIEPEPLFTDDERSALSGFLAGYTGATRDAYTLDLRQYTNWCQQHHLHLFAAHRTDIECFGRDMESRGRARATVARRLCTIAGFYRYAVEEDLLEHPRPCTSAVPGWTTNHTPPRWTATKSARCWFKPGRDIRVSTP